MNAAFLLVTTSWLAGADPAPPPAHAPAAAPAAVAVTSSCGGDCCNSGCNSCCEESCGHNWFGRLREKFHRNCNECCESSCGCNSGHSSWSHGNNCNSCNTCSTGCNECCEESCGHRWFGKMKGWFHRGCESDCGCNDCGSSGCGGGCGNTYSGAYGVGAHGYQQGGPGMKVEPIPAPKGAGEQPRRMPSDTKPQADGGKPQASLTIETETRSPFELSRRYHSRVEHAADYSRLTGQLFFVHADGGLWVLRYAPLSEEDPNGGSVVLARDLSMDQYHEGDLVAVQGEILSRRSSAFLGGPLYRAQSIQLVERATP